MWALAAETMDGARHFPTLAHLRQPSLLTRFNQAHCSSRGLKISGNKDELISRLLASGV